VQARSRRERREPQYRVEASSLVFFSKQSSGF
jgi:hypothetical protein